MKGKNVILPLIPQIGVLFVAITQFYICSSNTEKHDAEIFGISQR
jgi:hypothetical protein